MKREAAALVSGSGRAISFAADKQIICDWRKETIKAASDGLLADPAVDVVIAVGMLSLLDLAGRPSLSKPVLAPFGIEPRFSGLPATADGKQSGKKNLNYLVYAANFKEDIAAFRKLTNESLIHVAVDRRLLQLMPALRKLAREVEQQTNTRLVPVMVDAKGDVALAAVPRAAKAVYLTPLSRMLPAERRKLLAGLIRRRLPSFSMTGRVEVEMGAMATQTRGIDFLRISRRMALNLERVSRGEDPGGFALELFRNRRLILNMDVANAIGLSPSWQVLAYAELYRAKRKQSAKRMTLGQAMKLAMASNWRIRAGVHGIEAQKARVKAAWAAFLPQVDFTFNHTTVRPEVADASFGSQPLHAGKVAGSARQFVFVEPVVANLTIQRHTQRSVEADLRTLKLDVVAATAKAFLGLLKAQANAEIRRNNALLTSENLETARIRRKVGVVGPSDVYRWESQLAVDRSRAISTRAQVRVALFQLNQLLARPSREAVTAARPETSDPTLVPHWKALQPYLDNPKKFDAFSDFVVKEGLAAAPELHQVQAALAAKRRLFVSRARALYLPQIQLQGEVSYIAYRKLADSPFAGIELPGGQTLSSSSPPRFAWFVGVGLSLPLFTGLRQTAEREVESREVAQLEGQRRELSLRIEQRVRATLALTRASRAAIIFAEQSAVAAAKNLRVTSDAYARGVASTITLLDAQNQKLTADLAAATASFDFLGSVVDLQRAVARFELFVSTEARDRWLERLRGYFAQR